MSIDILLATYNGGRFLKGQLKSIADQTHENWHLIIRDDGSTDDTLKILKDFASKYDSKVTLINEDLGGLGATGNFSALMRHSTEPYILFSDQDDIWEVNKIEDMLKAIRNVEAQHSKKASSMSFCSSV